jgi:hypothetical protein
MFYKTQNYERLILSNFDSKECPTGDSLSVRKICVRVLADNELKLHCQSHIGTAVGCSQAVTAGYTAHPFHKYNLVWKFIVDWRAWVLVGRKQIPFHGPFVFRSS